MGESAAVLFRVCYYHVIWGTRNRQPLITPEIEAVLGSAIMRKSSDLNRLYLERFEE
jgi:REP element-mobilizing transposase RayT